MRLLRHHHPPSAPPPVDRRDGNSATRAPSRPDDFAAVYDTHFPAVYGYFLRQLGDPQAAEDATSQTFLKALNGFPSYRETGRFRSWLFAIAHNVLLDTHRAHHPDEPLDAAGEIHDPSASPEDRALAALDADRLDRAIARLPPDDREVLELRRGGLTGREIAAALGIGHEAAKKRQLRAMDRIRAELMTWNYPRRPAMERDERRRRAALDRYWDATQRGETPTRPPDVDAVTARVVDLLAKTPTSPDQAAARLRVRQRIVAAANTTEETMHASALPLPSTDLIARPPLVHARTDPRHRYRPISRLAFAALVLVTLVVGYARFGPVRPDGGEPVKIPAAVLATEVATPAEAEPYPGADHVIIGAWEVDWSACVAGTAPARMVFGPDGRFVESDDARGVGVGLWRATGERTVEVVAVVQDYASLESMFGVAENLPLPDSFAVEGTIQVISYTIEVEETGMGFTAQGFYEPRTADGSVIVHLEYEPDCPIGIPAYRMVTVERAGATPTP